MSGARRALWSKLSSRCAPRDKELSNSDRKPSLSGTICCPREELQLTDLYRPLALGKDSIQIVTRDLIPGKGPVLKEPCWRGVVDLGGKGETKADSVSHLRCWGGGLLVFSLGLWLIN